MTLNLEKNQRNKNIYHLLNTFRKVHLNFLQFTELDEFNPEAVFSPSLFVDIRKKVVAHTFDELSNMVIKMSQIESNKLNKTHYGELKIDATVADQ